LTLTIAAITSILVVGGFVLAPDAYSAKNHDDIPDECSCEKPDTLHVSFTAPTAGVGDDYRVEIFKKLDDRENDEKRLGMPIPVSHGDLIIVKADNFGKDKLESNTAFVVYRLSTEVGIDDTLVSLMEIHTSCSKPLFIGMPVDDTATTNNGYSLVVEDGLLGDPAMTSIPIGEPLTCEDKKSKSTGTITIRKALTNDNGGTAAFEDFTITVTNVKTTEPFVIDDMDDDPWINTKDVPAGTYTISETVTDPFIGKYTTVLIAGDTGCPSMVDEVFTIKKGKTLSCTIYNDDNGDGDNGEIEPGVIFHFGTVTFDNNEGTSVPRCDGMALDLPCAFEDGDGLFSIVPKLKPIESLHETTLVLMSVVGLFADNTNDPDSSTGCTFDGLTSFTEKIDDGDDIIHSSFRIQCSPLSGTDKIYRINYALVETQI
jgi:hypothetical protein